MAWTTPRTWVTGEIVSATNMNVHVRDNLLDLDRRTVAATATVATLQSSTSTSYTDLASTGPAVTANVGPQGFAIVILSAYFYNATGGNTTWMGHQISGATSRSPADQRALMARSDPGNQDFSLSRLIVETGLTSGNNTFTAKYRAGGGTGNWADRYIAVLPASR